MGGREGGREGGGPGDFAGGLGDSDQSEEWRRASGVAGVAALGRRGGGGRGGGGGREGGREGGAGRGSAGGGGGGGGERRERAGDTSVGAENRGGGDGVGGGTAVPPSSATLPSLPEGAKDDKEGTPGKDTEGLAAPPPAYPQSFREILEMTERGETPPGIVTVDSRLSQDVGELGTLSVPASAEGMSTPPKKPWEAEKEEVGRGGEEGREEGSRAREGGTEGELEEERRLPAEGKQAYGV
ncbi:hypothetical protein Naga_101316g1 [Nannochloropsis gaditana]|uniref:Peroxisomal membrane protein PEX14-like KPWE domain-containing protein n=1 Tax=Nannochloropsis gaditana TaxID=72520 RepID=W7TKS7_9STRA|nr:hypothetical protein Naga_101316g1 [Nannochloropsis gaditana]